jgi:hypothetical protein
MIWASIKQDQTRQTELFRVYPMQSGQRLVTIMGQWLVYGADLHITECKTDNSFISVGTSKGIRIKKWPTIPDSYK